ncbi:hypothetical protein M413DRAFT_447435 [Hebeloma cylindrosporum]|uniref:Uncharacterized protein n=1 Tax=Hebeloma cylindrosporum TaxID=76867 RepID=A0A0C2XN29_HEBCY|nr:hypothetical protein M413DRAFT_447435 [Hebeloma cylindrosporum h7]
MSGILLVDSLNLGTPTDTFSSSNVIPSSPLRTAFSLLPWSPRTPVSVNDGKSLSGIMSVAECIAASGRACRYSCSC